LRAIGVAAEPTLDEFLVEAQQLHRPITGEDVWPFRRIIGVPMDFTHAKCTGASQKEINELLNLKGKLCKNPKYRELSLIKVPLIIELAELQAVEMVIKSVLETRGWGNMHQKA